MPHQNKILQKQQEQAEKNLDIIQDTMALDQEIEYQQQQMQDMMDQQKVKMQEGLEDEFDALLAKFDTYQPPTADKAAWVLRMSEELE